MVNIELSEESQNLKVGEKRRAGVDDLGKSDVGGRNTIHALTSMIFNLDGRGGIECLFT